MSIKRSPLPLGLTREVDDVIDFCIDEGLDCRYCPMYAECIMFWDEDTELRYQMFREPMITRHIQTWLVLKPRLQAAQNQLVADRLLIADKVKTGLSAYAGEGRPVPWSNMMLANAGRKVQ
jgi:hypothetical protein